MASTVEGQRLTELQRREQVRIAAELIAQLRVVWPLLDVRALDFTAPGWVAASIVILRQQFNLSASTALEYLARFRSVELSIPLVPILNVAVELAAAASVSLLVTGPVRIKQLVGKGVAPEVAKASAFNELARTAQMHVLNGGRDALVTAIRSDRRALGYQRVTDSDPCYFCAMLASRGPVYRKNSFANVRVHGGCGCTMEAAYRRDTEWAGRSRQWSALWDASTRGLSGPDAMRAFRSQFNAFEGHTQSPRGPRVTPLPRLDLNSGLAAEAKALQTKAQQAFARGDTAERIRLQSEASEVWRRFYTENGRGLAA